MSISAWCCAWWRPASDFTSSASGVGWAGCMTAYRLPRPGFRHQCSKVRGSGKEGRGSQGWRAKKGCLITQNKALNKRKHGSSSSGLSLSSSGLSRSVDVRICSLALDSRLAAGGALLNSLRQSLETDTGVNHHSLAHCFPARLQTRSPLSAFRLPTPPSPQQLSRLYWCIVGFIPFLIFYFSKHHFAISFLPCFEL